MVVRVFSSVQQRNQIESVWASVNRDREQFNHKYAVFQLSEWGFHK